MDVFRFLSPETPTKLEWGKLVNGLRTKMWVERYRDAGEFEFTGYVSSGLREALPIGALISHTNTTEVMVVENHEINDESGQESIITITGRSYETILEQRIAGANQMFPVSGVQYVYTIGSDYTWVQAKDLIENHILASELIHDDNAIPYIEVIALVDGVGEMLARTIARGTVYSRLLELMKIDNLGIKTIRPNPLSPAGLDNPNTTFLIHKGIDRSASVIFSYDAGEIESADYLWSNKKVKNAALLTGKWVEMVVVPLATGIDRRWMHINASDIDDEYTEAPEGGTLMQVMNLMYARGAETLAAQREVVLTKAEVKRDALKIRYREDYDVGDIIMVRGEYDAATKMRVSEYVEIEDENGEVGYPTLTKEDV